MKNIATMISSIILGAITLLIVMTVQGRMNRSTELESNLSSIIEETVEIMTVDKKYDIEHAEEFLADFQENLAAAMYNDANIKVKVRNMDMEKGLLSICAIGEYTHPNGKKGTVACERTVILDKKAAPESEIYTVQFFFTKEDASAGICYKVYQVSSGDTAGMPAAPNLEGRQFVGWKDADGNRVDFSVPVTQNQIYYAEWK